MSKQTTIQISYYPQDQAIRAGEFSLMPINPDPPYIVSQPIKNFSQLTWIQEIDNDIPVYQEVAPILNKFSVLQGTKFTLGVKAMDPSNINDIHSMSRLSFKWKKDGASITSLNLYNGGVGTPAAIIPEDQSTPSITGEYVCEVSNAYGTVETEPFSVDVIDPFTHPKLYKNLLINGDGDGGSDGWEVDVDIKTMPFLSNIALTKNFGSFRLGGLITFDYQKDITTSTIPEFHFSTASHRGNFYSWYQKRYKADPSFRDSNKISLPETAVPNPDDQWMMQGVIPQIVLNEDYNKSEYAGFFPGLAWMDQYNKNNGPRVIGLYGETKRYTPTYFTREKLKFTKFGGRKTSTMTQLIDVSDAADFIDGNVCGVKYVTSQFFAYVGAGISDYKIKIQTNRGIETHNYYIADSEQYYDFSVKSDFNLFHKTHPVFPEAEGTGERKVVPLPNTDIEVMPIVYDKTIITLDFLDEKGMSLKTETINGPEASDVWAIKEKVFFPLTLYSIFEFVRPSNNNITVFGQKYTSTNALAGFFEYSFKQDIRASFSKQKYKLYTPKDQITYSGLFGNGVFARTAHPWGFDNVADKAARFFLTNYDFKKYGAAYPTNVPHFWEHRKWKALNDYGAAAMFGVGRDVILPTKTRSVKISVTFSHNSNIIYDDNPEMKGWEKQEIYTDDWGQGTGHSRRLSEYGAPRCGITKMKFQLIPNNIEASDRYASYSIPPANNTVLGLQKMKYMDPNAFNTEDATTFEYKVVLPEKMETPPITSNPFILAQDFSAYINALHQDELANLSNTAQETTNEDPEEDNDRFDDMSDTINEQEDVDISNGDHDATNETPPWRDPKDG